MFKVTHSMFKKVHKINCRLLFLQYSFIYRTRWWSHFQRPTPKSFCPVLNLLMFFFVIDLFGLFPLKILLIAFIVLIVNVLIHNNYFTFHIYRSLNGQNMNLFISPAFHIALPYISQTYLESKISCFGLFSWTITAVLIWFIWSSDYLIIINLIHLTAWHDCHARWAALIISETTDLGFSFFLYERC